MQRTKQQHEERQEALLNPAPREELLKERTRVEENIARLRKETDNLKEQTIRATKKMLDDEYKAAAVNPLMLRLARLLFFFRQRTPG